MEKINLIMLPYSGASKYSYAAYSKVAPSYINFIPVEIPGRGTRAGEDLLTDIHAIADDIFLQVKGILDEPYAIYGHSMGGILTYLLTHKIVEAGLPLPVHLFVTGCTGPSMKYRGLVDYRLPKDEFVKELRELGGTTDQILNDEMLMEFFLPILRADFEAVDGFKYEERTPFNIPLTAIIGSDEDATMEEVEAWKKETSAEAKVMVMDGNHFFIFDHTEEIMNLISNRLQERTLAS